MLHVKIQELNHAWNLKEQSFEANSVMLSMILSCVDGQVGDRVAVPFILSCGNCRQCARSRPTICEAHHSGHVDVSRFQAWEMRHENP